jgi:biopolymer transport protein ExbD
MAGGGGNADGDVGFQIAPMIDLILVLMVFFMSTVALKQVENELGIQLPGKGTAATSGAQQDLNIGIDEDGSVNINGDAVGAATDKELMDLRARLKEQVELFDNNVPVIINPKPDVPHVRVIDVLNACSAAKIKNISFGG